MSVFEKKIKTKSLFIFIGILVGAMAIAQGAVLFGPKVVALFALPLIFLSIYNFRYGVVVLFIYGASIFQLARFLESGFPFGILFDLLIVLMFFSTLFTQSRKNKLEFKIAEPITKVYIIMFLYLGLQILNPNATSVEAWIRSTRSITLLLLFFIFISFFLNGQHIKKFIKLWYGIAIVAALYGLYQEIFGLFDFEWKYVYASPERYSLFFNWGHMRVFSIFSDPSTYGIFMAFSGLSMLILAFGPISVTKRAVLLILSSIILVSMSFSGTRTAYAMIILGIVFFIIFNIQNSRVLVGSMILVFGFVLLMVGPFYSSPILRIRSTFNFNSDPSMKVRDTNRVVFQEYIRSHPIGGGVNTTGVSGRKYSPAHPLAGKPPDSGYIHTALELGVVGLLLLMMLNLLVIIKGIFNYFSIKDPLLRFYNLAFVVPFFALSIANYTQDAMIQKPIVILVVATYALIIKIKDIDDSLERTSE